MSHAKELEVLLAALRASGGEVMKRYASFARIEDAPADISTDADRASQALIFSLLSRAFPGDRLCGEEITQGSFAFPADAPRCWIVDPIDGTRGFAVKNDEFSIMIGLCEQGEVVAGGVYEPAIDRVTYAARGSGCFVRQPWSADAVRCHVSGTTTLAAAVFSISRSQKAAGRRRLLDAFGASDAVETYSAGIKLAQVARGETDVYLGDYLTLKDWDVCAGHLLVTEAGGRVSNVAGEPIRYLGDGSSLGGKGLLATNGKLHEPVLDVLRAGRYVFA